MYIYLFVTGSRKFKWPREESKGLKVFVNVSNNFQSSSNYTYALNIIYFYFAESLKLFVQFLTDFSAVSFRAKRQAV